MDRRDFLKARNQPAQKFRRSSGLTTYTGSWSINEVQHLLKRTMFGSTKRDIDYFLTKTVDSAIDELLSPTAPYPGPPVNDYQSSLADPTIAAGDTWVNNNSSDDDLNAVRTASYKKWWTGLIINQDRSIREKLTLFWMDHFGTETSTIGIANFAYRHNELLRKDGLGDFRKLVKDVTVDAGMLIYLNGYLNRKGAPDENYARELMELFTQGKGQSVAYTEEDVRTAAKVLTGWRIDTSTFNVYFDDTRHDISNKSFSSYYGNTVINGKAGASGAAETDELIAMLFTKDEVSKYICRCIYRWFVYYKIDQGVEQDVIIPLAAAFRSSGYNIKVLLGLLLKSEHFFDVLNQGCIIKSPVDHVTGCMREFNVVFPDPSADAVAAYGMWNYLQNWMSNMGQRIGDPPDVSGWPAYYQEPSFHELWISSDTLPKRNQFTDNLVFNGYTRMGKTIVIDVIAFTKTLSNPGDPNVLISDALSILYRVPLSETSKQQIKQSILLTGQTQDYYWTNAWNAYLTDPSNMTASTIIGNRLKSLYQYLMNLSEYQLS